MKTIAKLLTGSLLLILFAASWVSALPMIDQQQTVIDLSVGGLGIGGASEEKLAQVVTAGVSGMLTEVRFPVACASGDLILEIQGVTGGRPNGMVMTSQIIPGAGLPSFSLPPGIVSFRSLVLTTPVSVTAGSQFAVVLSSSGACGVFQGPVGDSYPGGNEYFDARPNAAGVWVCTCDFEGDRFDLPFQTLVESGAGGVIAGFVKNDSNAGIGNVRVQIYGAAVMPMPTMLIGEIQTDANGGYRMSGLQTGTYLVCFDGSLSNYTNECYNDKPWNFWSDIANATPVPVTTGQTTTLSDAALSLGGAITGSVKNVSGTGIGNAWVTVYDSNNMWIKQVQTDQAGNYIAGGLQTGSYKICFDATMMMAGYLNECYDNQAGGDIANANLVAVMTGLTTVVNDVVLMQGGVITGTVRNMSNTGIGNVSVQVYNLNGMPTPMPAGSTQTDPSGNYSVGGLQTGAYKVCFAGSLSGYINECYNDKPWTTWNDIVSADTVSIVAGQTMSLNEAVLASGGSISGQVTSDGVSGIPGVWVSVCRYDGMTGMCGYAGGFSTDQNGNYTVGGLSTGSYKIWFDTSMLIMSGSDYLSHWYDNKADEANADTVMVTAPAASMVNVQPVKGGRISGTVTNGTAGIPGVWVRAYDSNGMPLSQMGMGATTNFDGTYSVGGLRANAYKVCFDSIGTGYLSQCYYNKAFDPVNADTVGVTSSQTTSNINAVLVSGGFITGSVRNGSGEGIGNVQVNVYDPTGMWVRGTSTDWSGNYSMGGLQTGMYRVCFNTMMLGNYLNECYDDKPWSTLTDIANSTAVSVTAGQTAILNDAVLARPGVIMGSVKNVGGSGIGNVMVTVYDWSMPMPMPMSLRSAQTDTNGNYTISGLPTGTYRVCFDGSQFGYINECYDDSPWILWNEIANATPVTVTAGLTTTLNDAVLARLGAIAGLVRNAGGAGIGNVTVTVYDWSVMPMPMPVRSAQTNTNGNFVIHGLQTGTYKVCFDGSLSNYMNECYDDIPWNSWTDIATATSVSVTIGERTILNEAVLAQGGAIAGVVKNGSSMGIGMVTVTVYDSNNLWIRSTTTDFSGSYTVGGLQTGSYRICFDGSMSGYGNECYDNQDLMNATPVPVAAGQTAILNDAVLGQLGAIAGSVRNGNGSGIGNVMVTAYDWSVMPMPMPMRSAQTDTNGNYTISGLQTGAYKVCFDGSQYGYMNECYDDKPWLSWNDIATATSISVTVGQTTSLNDAVLAPGGTIAGFVKNGTGAGIGMVAVNIYDSNNTIIRGTLTDWSGKYTLGGLQGGDYKVCFEAGVSGYLSECYDDQEWMNWANATLVSVVTAQTTTLPDAVLAQAGTIAGSVKNSSNSGIGMVMVTIYDTHNMMIRSTQTDWSGNYAVNGLQSGNYKVCFDAMMTGGYPSECYDDQAWMDLDHATLVSVASGQTTTLHDAVLTQAVYYTVSTSAGPGGSISPASQSILNGTSALFTVIPAAGYEVSSVSGCGGIWFGGNSYNTAPITIDCTVTAAFSRIVDIVPDAFIFIDQTGVALNTLVTSNAITVSGINDPAPISITGGQYSVNSGAFTAAAGTVNNGDSVRVQLISSAVYTATTNATLAIGGVSCAFSVTTLAIPVYTITATAGTGGSVMPSGTLSVNSGNSALFTITPNDGYHIADVSVDGVSQGNLGTYTFTNVQTNHTISASFMVESNLSFSVRAALIKWWNKQQTLGFVTMTADFGAAKPAGNDVVSVSLDGVQLFAAPFSEFKRGSQPGAYLLVRQDLLVRLDFTTHRLFVATPKMSLAGLAAGNGVDVQISVGAATAVEKIVMTPAPANSLIFRRIGVVGEP